MLGGAAKVKMIEETSGERSTMSSFPDSILLTLSSMFNVQKLMRSVYECTNEDVDMDGTIFDELVSW